MKNGYSICFNEWALDKSIKSELGLLLIISGLTAKEGYCYAGNEYFANLFDVSEETISRKINKLSSKGYVSIEYFEGKGFLQKREIKLSKPLTTIDKNVKRTIDENVKRTIDENVKRTIDENVKYNNTNINNTNRENENRAFSFLKSNYSGRLETQILMRYKSQIKDFKKFTEQYNNTVDIEDLEWKPNILFGRLNKFAINWVSNQDKYAKPDAEAQPTYLRKTL